MLSKTHAKPVKLLFVKTVKVIFSTLKLELSAVGTMKEIPSKQAEIGGRIRRV
jgi:hypothetical protein